MSRRRGPGGNNLGLLLLGSQILSVGVDNIPPVTLGLIAGQVAIFLDCFHKYFPSAYGVCMSPYLITHHRDWYRLILGALYHADDMHLYFNMVSLLYKGLTLERKFGSPYYAYLVSVFTILTSVTYVGLGMILGKVLDPSYTTSCAVGFSGVIFALKVLATEYSPGGTQYVLGLVPIPSKYIFWVELILIQLITPNASFVGHLAGILVGLAYTKGPLKPMMDSFLPPDASQRYTRAQHSGQRRANYFPFSRFWSGGGGGARFASQPRHRPADFTDRGGSTSSRGSSSRMSSGYAQPSAPPPEDDHVDYNRGPERPPAEATDFHHFTGGLDENDQMRRAMEESMWQQSDPSRNPSMYGGANSTNNDDEQKELQKAMEDSIRQPNSHSSSSSERLYPNISDLRARRAEYYK